MGLNRGCWPWAAAGWLAALLTACGGGVPGGGDFAAPSLRSQASSSGELLYVSDAGANAVYVYSYPDGTLLQTLTGFDTPLRECADSAGHVFITNTNGGQIIEYAHGGEAPVATLLDPNQLPVDCSVDPLTQNLAVTNYGEKGAHAGSVSIYANSRGKAKKHRAPGVVAYLFCTYDDLGNLFVTGLDNKYNLVFLELPRGKRDFLPIALKKNIGGWGGVQWDGEHVTIGDGAATVYRFSVNNQIARLAGSVKLKHASNVAAYLLSGDQLIAPDGPNGGNHDVEIWNYPAGGHILSKIGGTFANPSGVALSIAASHR